MLSVSGVSVCEEDETKMIIIILLMFLQKKHYLNQHQELLIIFVFSLVQYITRIVCVKYVWIVHEKSYFLY